MSDESAPEDEPAWHLLPDNPVGFFGLQAGFDRKDLKRAYNVWLRRFKPDKFPQEFQRLRAAYEQLDGELRYGESTQAPPSRMDQLAWKPFDAHSDPPSVPVSRDRNPVPNTHPDSEPAHPPHQGPDDASPAPITEPLQDRPLHDRPLHDRPLQDRPLETGPRDNGPLETADKGQSQADPIQPLDPALAQQQTQSKQPQPSKSLAERIDSEAAASLYEELKQRPGEPYDYYVLALLSDAVAEPGELLFLHWLIQGLKAYPGHHALTQLLIAYFQDGDLPDDQLAAVLVRVSEVIRSDRFYYLTEKLFDRLTLAAAWPQVEETLERCAANINDHQIRSKVVFTCHLVRRALWLAPIAKCQEWMLFVNEHYEYLEGTLEYEQELNSLLLSYMEGRARFVKKGPIAAMMDQALRKYCLDIDGRGDYEIVKTQAHIAQHPDQLFSEFGLIPQEDQQHLVPWIWISSEVEDRLETQDHPPKAERLMGATFQMLQQIDRNFPLGPIQFYNFLDKGVPLFVCVMLAIVMPATLGTIMDHYWPAVSGTGGAIVGVSGVGLAVCYWFWLQKRTTNVWLIKYLRRSIEHQYLSWWRSLIGRFFAATHFRYADVQHAVDAVLETRRSELSICNWLPHFYGRDPALYVYATAARFLR